MLDFISKSVPEIESNGNNDIKINNKIIND